MQFSESHRYPLPNPSKEMTFSEAIQILVDIAGRWGENTEEGFSRRIKPIDSDKDCKEIAAATCEPGEDSDLYYDDVIEVRNLWRAIEKASAEIRAVEPAPR